MDKRKMASQIGFAAAILLLVLAMLYSGLRILESTVLSPDTLQETAPRKTVEHEGTEYFPRQDITVILVMGIDEEGPMVSSGSYRNTGETDMVALVILDEADRSCSILSLNRDTMLEMPVLGIGGKRAGTAYGQLALSHTYGSGLADSAENTKTAVSDFLGGIRIDYYVAVNIDGIGILNDLVEGVTVNVTDDFSQVDPSITPGLMRLNSQQALTFVRSRKDVGTQLNLSRMERHKEYLKGLSQGIREKAAASDTFAAQAYERLADFMVTDCSANAFSGLLSRCSDYTLKEIVTPQGENKLGQEFYEFYADEESLKELTLRLLYAPKQ